MANWWDSAPRVDGGQRSSGQAGGNWWEAAPVMERAPRPADFSGVTSGMDTSARRMPLHPSAYDAWDDELGDMSLAEQNRAFKEGSTFLGRLGDNIRRGWLGLQANIAAGPRMAQIERGAEGAETGDVMFGTDPLGMPIYASQAYTRGQLPGVVDAQVALGDAVAGDLAQQVAPLQAEMAALPQRPATEALLQADTFREGLGALLTDPLGVIGDIGVPSTVQMGPALAASAVVRRPAFTAGAMGATSAINEFGAGVVGYLADQGVDVADPEALQAALGDPELVRGAANEARVRSGIIGSVDAASGGLAGRTLVPQAVARSAAGREAVNVLAAQPLVQAAMGAGGEAAAQFATRGEIQPGEVLAEALGEMFMAPAEVGPFAVQRSIDAARGRRGALGDSPEDGPAQPPPRPAAPQPAPDPAQQPAPAGLDDLLLRNIPPAEPAQAQGGEPSEGAGGARPTPAPPITAPAAERPSSQPTMQNRDRGRAASVAQMQDIRRNPDPARLGFSRDANTGAPMVSRGQDIPAQDLGRTDAVVMPDGRRVPVQYAVVEADAVQASHDADGNVNPDYDAAPLQALNNGRTAGLQAAWRAGNAATYRDGIAADADFHGVPAEAIASKRQPVLVRLYDPAENLSGAESNASQQLGLSPVEQAQTDASLLPDLSGIQWAEDGSLNPSANANFFRAWFRNMGETQAATLQDAQGRPNAAALQRVRAAMVQRAYGDERLLTALVEDTNPDNRNVMTALVQAAPAFASLDQGNAVGGQIREALTGGLQMLRDASARGISLADAIAQQDMFGRNEDADAVAGFMAANARSAKRMAEAFRAMAEYAGQAEQQAATLDVFGDAPTPTVRAGMQRAGMLQEQADGRVNRDAGAPVRDGEGQPGEQAPGRAAAGDARVGERQDGYRVAEEQPGLFAGPTRREEVDAERRRRDAERDGRTGTGRTDMAAGPGDLFAGRRPQQARIPDRVEDGDRGGVESTRDMFVPTRGDRQAQREDQSRNRPKDRDSAAEARARRDAERAGLRPDATPSLTRRGKYAIESLVRRFGGSVLADRIARNFREKDTAQLIGQKIKTPADLAALADVYRNPIFEVLRYVFVDDAGNVVHETAVSTRMPSAAEIFPAEHMRGDDGLRWLESEAKSKGATGLWLLHNHPSGDPTPSAADRAATSRLAQDLKSTLPVQGHVVLNHKRYGAITPDGRTSMHTLEGSETPDPLVDVRGDLAGKTLDHSSVALVGKRLLDEATSPDSVVLITIDAKWAVTSVVTLPTSVLRNKRAGALSAMIGKRSAANFQIAVMPEAARAKNAGVLRRALNSGLLTDVITVDEGGATQSAASRGHGGHRFDRVLDRRRRSISTRVYEGDSPTQEQVEESRDVGEAEAEMNGLREAVERAVGKGRVTFLHGIDGLPDRLRDGVRRRLEQRGGRGRTAALYDPNTKQVYLFTDVVTSPERAVWNALHEIAGHHGLREFLGDNLDRALELGLQNPTVRQVAEAIARERKIDIKTQRGRLLAAEEALAELAAAVRTGDFAQIESRYGAEVGEGIRERVTRAIENFVRRLKALIEDVFGTTFTDEDVRALLENAWQAAQVNGPTMAVQQADGSTISEQVQEGGRADSIDGMESAATDQTQTPAFRRWFGDSKVVDANGDPLVVYHGTTAPEFDVFRPGEQAHDAGIFFTDNEFVAEGIYGEGVAGLNIDALRERLDGMSDAELKAALESARRAGRLWWLPAWEEVFEPGVEGASAFAREELVGAIESAFDRDDGLEQRADYAMRAFGVQDTRAGREGSRVVGAYLSLQRPLEIDARGDEFDPGQQARWIAQARDEGHDGLIIRNYVDGTFGDPGMGSDLNSPAHTVYIAFEPSQVKSATGNRGTFDPDSDSILESVEYTPEQQEFMDKAGVGVDSRGTLQKARDWMGGKMPDVQKDALIQSTLNRYYGLNRAVEAVGGIDPENDPYIAARQINIASTMEAILRFGAPKMEGGALRVDRSVPGLFDALMPVHDNLPGFFGWMVARRAQLLKSQGRENLMSDADIQAGLSLRKGNEAAFDEAARNYLRLKNAILDFAEQHGGTIDPVARAAWDHAEYIPFYRDAGEGGFAGPGTRRGLSHQSAGIRQLKGGEQALRDPLQNIIQNFTRLMDSALKNRAMLLAVDQLGAPYFKKAPHQVTAATIPLDQVKKHLQAQGVPQATIDAMPESALKGVGRMLAVKPPEGDNIVRVMRNGKAEYYEVLDELVLRSVTALNEKPMPRWFKPAVWAKNLLTAGATSTPDFILRNLFRDTGEAAVTSRERFIPLVDTIKGAAENVRMDEFAQDLMMAGSYFHGGLFHQGDFEATARATKRALRRHGLTDSQAEKIAKTLINPKRWWDVYRAGVEASEMGSRISLARNRMQAGGTFLEAAHEAKDFLDFTLRGDSTALQFLLNAVPFMNARLQGNYRLARMGTAKDRKRAVLMRMVSMGMATAALYAWNMLAHREEYEKLQDWDKDAYWHIAPGTDRHVRIPKPFELGLIAGTAIERGMAALAYHFTDGEAGDRAGRTMEAAWRGILETLALNPTPQILKPGMEVYFNENTFTGRPIESRSDEFLPPADRRTPHTSDTLAAASRGMQATVGEDLTLSPKQLQHLWRGYFGGFGMYFLDAADVATRALEDAPPKPASRARDLPGIGALYRGSSPDSNTRWVDEMYTLRDQATTRSMQIKRAVENGETARAERLQREHGWLLGPAQASKAARGGFMHGGVRELNRATAALAKLRKADNAIYEDREMTRAEKRDALDKNARERDRIAQDLVRKIRRRQRTARD